MEQIAANAYASNEYPGCTLGFYVMPAGVVAVDAPVFPRDARAWRRRILETAGVPILYLVVTDANPDRMLSASLLGAPVVASRGTYEQAVGYTDGYWRSVADRWVRRYPESDDDPNTSRLALPEVLFTHSLSLHKGGRDLTVCTVSGSCEGSAWLYVPEEDVLFAGDTVVADTHPFIASSPDTRAWLETLRALRRPRFSATTIVPGRGLVCDASATQPLSDYITLARRRVRSLHKASRPRGDTAAIVSELVSLFPVPEGECDWVQRRVRADLDRVYDELAEEQADG
jgi:glyoxylase-like metal-dependent hydrolase (beta-lactamase superfamily II)